MSNRPINASRADELYYRAGDWHVVGVLLAKEEGRPAPYQAEALRRAHRKWYKSRRARQDERESN